MPSTSSINRRNALGGRAVLLACALLCLSRPDAVSAQVRGAYLPLDHTAHTVAEFLVTRGVLLGLDAMSRPFPLDELRASVARAEARGVEGDGDIERLAWLQAVLGRSVDSTEWAISVAPDVGALGATSAVPELLLPASDSTITPTARLRIGAEFGPAAFQFEPQRVQDGRARIPLALARVGWSWGWIQWGEVERNWGVPGVNGLLVAPLAGSRPELAFGIGPQVLRFEYRAAPLSDGVSTSTGETVARYWAMHRLRWRPMEEFELAVWETSLSSETGGPDAARASPFTPFYFPGQQDRDNARNTTMGLDVMWRPSSSVLLETQLLADDIYKDRTPGTEPYPHRYGYTVQARGPLGPDRTWRVYTTALSGLALINRRPEDSFLDDGQPLGRLRPDHFEAGGFVTIPWGFASPGAGPSTKSWPGPGSAEVGVKWRRQGIRTFDDPWPVLPPGTPRYPTFSPEVEREVWAFVGNVDWMAGPFTLQTETHLQYRRFPDAGGDWEWGLESIVEVVWRIGRWNWSGQN